MADDELIKKFVDLHTQAGQFIAEEKVAEARQKYLELLDAYHAIDKSTLEAFHKELAYDQVTKLFAQINETKEKVKLPVNLIAAAVLIIAFSFVIFLRPEIVGLVSFEDEIVQPLELTFTQTDVESITLKDRPLTLSASGSFTGKVKLFYKQGEKLELMFDSEKSLSNNGEFSRVCEETCKISSSTNVVELFAQVEEGSSLKLNELVYKVERKENRAPIWVGKVRRFAVPPGKTITIDLSKFFEDPDKDSLVYLSTSQDGLEVTVQNEQVTITAKPGTEGTRTLTFIASDLAEVTKIPVTIEIQ
ncbi:MAG TPA: hypothetical protein VI612_03260 [Candidatus Nanoarchaeia archaeon]|nr:hypothetical protein [Candidatus Nanoarchaeia archaeon]